jgi:colanic acid biosynthesis glycosyl transferase WcaI
VRILVVTQYFLPEPLANAEVIGGLASALADLGHDVHVVTPARRAATSGGVTVHRALGWFPQDRQSVPKRLLEYLSFSIGAVVASLRVPRPDVVLVPSPPPTLGVVGLLISWLRRSRLVYNVQDLYPEIAEATGTFRGGVLVTGLRRVLRIVYRRSAAVVVIDPYFVDVIRRAEPAAVVEAVRNGIDLRPFADAERDPQLLESIGVPSGARVVMYAGNVGRSQDLGAVVTAARAANAHLVVHGGGAGVGDLKEMVTSTGATHVHFSAYRPRTELGAVFASADLHVVPLKPGIASSSVPSKLLSIFAAGRAAVVAAEPGSPAAEVVEESNGGWVVSPGDEESLIATVTKALGDPDELDRRGTAARQWARDNAGTERAARDYDAVLRRAVTSRG